MNWRQATLGQLYEIAYNDTEAPLQHKMAALEEIRRRLLDAVWMAGG
jgi:hypothetical protein